MTDQPQEEIKEEIRYQTIAEFLESTPPNQLIHISDLSQWSTTGGYGHNNIKEKSFPRYNCTAIMKAVTEFTFSDALRVQANNPRQKI